MRRLDGGEEERDVKIKTKRREEEEDRGREGSCLEPLCGIVTHFKTMLPLLVMVTDCSLPLILIHHLAVCVPPLVTGTLPFHSLSSALWRASLPGEREETRGGAVHDHNSSKTTRPSWEPKPDPFGPGYSLTKAPFYLRRGSYVLPDPPVTPANKLAATINRALITHSAQKEKKQPPKSISLPC